MEVYSSPFPVPKRQFWPNWVLMPLIENSEIVNQIKTIWKFYVKSTPLLNPHRQNLVLFLVFPVLSACAASTHYSSAPPLIFWSIYFHHFPLQRALTFSELDKFRVFHILSSLVNSMYSNINICVQATNTEEERREGFSRSIKR